ISHVRGLARRLVEADPEARAPLDRLAEKPPHDARIDGRARVADRELDPFRGAGELQRQPYVRIVAHLVANVVDAVLDEAVEERRGALDVLFDRRLETDGRLAHALLEVAPPRARRRRELAGGHARRAQLVECRAQALRELRKLALHEAARSLARKLLG